MRTSTFLLRAALLPVLSLFSFPRLSAQYIAVVSPAGQTTMCTTFSAAIREAEQGSFIYLPGNRAGLNIPAGEKIDKQVHIVGVGYRDDNNPSEGRTLLRGNLHFVTGADGSSVTGVSLEGNILIGDTGLGRIGSVVNNLFIHRNLFNSIIRNYDSNKDSLACSGLVIAENVIYGKIDLWCPNVDILNNIISNGLNDDFYNIKGGNILNNIFPGNRADFNYCSQLNVSNNIFPNEYSLYSSSFSNFSNNIICKEGEGKDNYWNITRDKLFKKWEGNSGYHTTDDYRLKDNSVGKNGGTDGTDVGIYGGRFPWKDGALPYNPHVNSAVISGMAAPDGTIQLKVNVTTDGY